MNSEKSNCYEQFKYPHLKNVKNINNNYSNVIFITRQIKLDGTQGAIFNEGNNVVFASRNVVLNESKKDNMRFRSEMKNHLQTFEKYFKDNPDNFLIGEWMPTTNMFYIFDEAKIIHDTLFNSKYLNFTERFKYLKNFNLNVLEPEIILKNEIPKNYSIEEIKDIIYKHSKFEGHSDEGYVFKIYSEINNEIIQIDKLKVLNKDYFTEKRIQIENLKTLKTTKTKQLKCSEELDIFFKDNPNVLEKAINKVSYEQNIEIKSIKNFIEKFRFLIVKELEIEYSEFLIDNNLIKNPNFSTTKQFNIFLTIYLASLNII